MRYLFSITIFLFTLSTTLKAQSTVGFKVGYFDRDSLLKIMPAMKVANDSMHRYDSLLNVRLDLMNQELRTKGDAYNENAKDWSPLIKALREKEYNDLQQRILEYTNETPKLSADYRTKMVTPVSLKIDNAAKKVADKKGYAYVFDGSINGMVIFADEAYNVFDDLCLELGIPVPEKSNTGSKGQVPAPATGFKMAYFDLDSLLAIMPEMKAATDSAQAYYSRLEDQLSKMNTRMEELSKEYEKVKNTEQEKAIAAKEKEIADLQQRISTFQLDAEADYNAYRKKLVEPIYLNITAAAKKTAKEKGYAFVLDGSTAFGAVLFANEKYDAFNDMCATLNIPLPKK